MSRQGARSSGSPRGPPVARLSMDSSRSLSSQPRSFLFRFEPISASTEKACALELSAAAERLLSLISVCPRKIHGREAGPGERELRPHSNNRKNHAHDNVYNAKLTEVPPKVIPTTSRRRRVKRLGPRVLPSSCVVQRVLFSLSASDFFLAASLSLSVRLCLIDTHLCSRGFLHTLGPAPWLTVNPGRPMESGAKQRAKKRAPMRA